MCLLLYFSSFNIHPDPKHDEFVVADNVNIVPLNLNSTNVTHLAYGVAANVLAALLYGSTFVPVKRIETGDGEKNLLLVKPSSFLSFFFFFTLMFLCSVSRHVLSVGLLCIDMGCSQVGRHDTAVA